VKRWGRQFRSRTLIGGPASPVPGQAMTTSQRKKVAAVCLAMLAAMVLIVLFAIVGFELLQREPYRLTLKRRADGQVVAQFARPDLKMVSPEFPIDLPIGEPHAAILRSRELSIPGCIIEFCDTTILPGRFRVRIGKSLFDVMEARIEADGRVFDWNIL
jgi:hypothetical protein